MGGPHPDLVQVGQQVGRVLVDTVGARPLQLLPAVVGGLSVALARTFTIIDPELKNPRTWQWERAVRVFELLL